jgi:hypothetical protein
MADSSSSGSPSGNRPLKRNNASRRLSEPSPSTADSQHQSSTSCTASYLSTCDDINKIVDPSIAGAGPAITKPVGEASGVSALLSSISLSDHKANLDEGASEEDGGDDERYTKFPAKVSDPNRLYCRTVYNKRIVTDAPLIRDESRFNPCAQKFMEQEQGQDLMSNHGIWFGTSTSISPAGANKPTKDENEPPTKATEKQSNLSTKKGRKASSSTTTSTATDVEMLSYAQTQEGTVKPVSNPQVSHLNER